MPAGSGCRDERQEVREEREGTVGIGVNSYLWVGCGRFIRLIWNLFPLVYPRTCAFEEGTVKGALEGQ